MHKPENPDACLGSFFIFNGEARAPARFNEEILVEGTSFYEVIKVKEGTPLFAGDHLERLEKSVKKRGMGTCPTASQLRDNITLLISKNPDIGEGNIRVMIRYPGNMDDNPEIYSYFIPHRYPTAGEYASGVPLTLSNAERQDVHSKILNIGFRETIRQKISEEGAYEALLVNRDGFITEGSKSIFFIIRDNKIVTPPEKDVLPGITRKYILELCRSSGVMAVEKRIHSTETATFESCFISGTSPGILAVSNIDNIIYNPGHPLVKELASRYGSLVENHIKINKPRYNKV